MSKGYGHVSIAIRDGKEKGEGPFCDVVWTNECESFMHPSIELHRNHVPGVG